MIELGPSFSCFHADPGICEKCASVLHALRMHYAAPGEICYVEADWEVYQHVLRLIEDFRATRHDRN